MGYTDRLDKAMRDEPEAVSVDEQRYQSEMARANARQRAMEEWWPFREMLLAVVADIEEHPWARGQHEEFRIIRKAVDRISRSL